jgi:replication initiation protein RepC
MYAYRPAGQGPASWQEVHVSFRGLVEGISRTAGLEELEAAAEALSSLADDILNLLETQVKITDMSANESHKERHTAGAGGCRALPEKRAARAVPP